MLKIIFDPRQVANLKTLIPVRVAIIIVLHVYQYLILQYTCDKQ